MGFIGDSIESLKSINVRQSIEQVIALGLPKYVIFLTSGMIVSSALVIWKLLMCVTGCESPVVVVLTESMEPAFQRVICPACTLLLY
ncbi:putative signal peptidase I [Helianthus annuus]|nr:putative signal peptidase I [Helianthus annuus]